MKAFLTLPLVGFMIFTLNCYSQKIDSTGKKIPLIPKDTSNQNERDNKLFVFVGEKISVTRLQSDPGAFDRGVTAKYKVLQRVYGYYDKDTIEFEAYDHHGRFSFAEHKNVLLYVSEYKGKLYHEKYMYDPVYKTKDGRWAGPYSDDYEHSYNEQTTVKPEKIDFAEEVSIPIKIKNFDRKQFASFYPEPYFKIVGDNVIVVYGNYVPELFQLKKEGVLTARQLFGDEKD